MTPEASRRAGFELLRFTAVPVTGALVVLEIDGRVPRRAGRFARQPRLLVEADGRPRLELAPVRHALDDDHWRGTYAVPAEALRAGARLALGLRGVLLDLPAPDEPDAADRLAGLAREANGLRRSLEAAEQRAADAEQRAAEAEQRAAEAEQRATEAEARTRAAEDERDAAAARADASELDAEQARTMAEDQPAVDDASLTAEMAAVIDAEARVADAEREAETLRARLQAAEAGTDVLRAELAEERERAQAEIAELHARLEAGPGDAPTTVSDVETTRPFTVAEERDADADATAPLPPAAPRAPERPAAAAARDDAVRRRAGIFDPLPADAAEHERHGPNLSPWIAVGALLLFAVALLGLLFGFPG